MRIEKSLRKRNRILEAQLDLGGFENKATCSTGLGKTVMSKLIRNLEAFNPEGLTLKPAQPMKALMSNTEK